IGLPKEEKRRRENALVVEDIRERLQAIAHSITARLPEVVRLRRVEHLPCGPSPRGFAPGAAGCPPPFIPAAPVGRLAPG
ncbi:chorismate-binding protein, partial [Klebsiella pneumoniae]|nr:chorismate-binding protein [Klebsiella pneumoniae]